MVWSLTPYRQITPETVRSGVARVARTSSRTRNSKHIWTMLIRIPFFTAWSWVSQFILFMIYSSDWRTATTEKSEALWKPSVLTHFVLKKAPKYSAIFRVCPEAGLEINNAEIRLSVFYNRMLNNRVAQGLLTKEDMMKRLLVHIPRLADMPRKLPLVLKGVTEFEQACLLMDGE